MLLATCVVLLQAAQTVCVSVLYMHVSFDDKHVIMRASARACVFTPDPANFYILIFILIIEFSFLGFLVSILTWSV